MLLTNEMIETLKDLEKAIQQNQLVYMSKQVRLLRFSPFGSRLLSLETFLEQLEDEDDSAREETDIFICFTNNPKRLPDRQKPQTETGEPWLFIDENDIERLHKQIQIRNRIQQFRNIQVIDRSQEK